MYLIKKKMVNQTTGKTTHVLLTNGHSEILEIPHQNVADKLAEVMNANSDSGHSYEVIDVKGKGKENE